MKLINLTPHALHFHIGTEIVEVPPSGTVARCETGREMLGEVDLQDGNTIPINRTSFGAIEGLPEPQEDTLYVVSAIVAQAAKDQGRDDLVIVDDAVRDDSGRIIGARALAVVA